MNEFPFILWIGTIPLFLSQILLDRPVPLTLGINDHPPARRAYASERMSNYEVLFFSFRYLPAYFLWRVRFYLISPQTLLCSYELRCGPPCLPFLQSRTASDIFDKRDLRLTPTCFKVFGPRRNKNPTLQYSNIPLFPPGRRPYGPEANNERSELSS